MSSRDASDRPSSLTGVLIILAGLVPMAVAVRLLPADPAAIHAPRWVLFLCGFAFVTAGIMIIGGTKPWLGDLCAMILFLMLGAVGAWVAMFGTAGAFSGGVPLLPTAWNRVLARFLFGGGALILFALALYTGRRLLGHWHGDQPEPRR